MKLHYLPVICLLPSCTVNHYLQVKNTSDKETQIVDLPFHSGYAKVIRLKTAESDRFRSTISRTSGLSTPIISISKTESRLRQGMINRGLTYTFPDVFNKYQNAWTNKSWLGRILSKNQGEIVFKNKQRAEFLFQGEQYQLKGE